VTAPVRLQPHAPARVEPLANVEAEAAWLGAALIENEIFDRDASLLSADAFYEPAHRRVFETIARLRAEGATVTPVTLRPHLDGDPNLRQLGGVSYLARLTADGQGLLIACELAEQIRDLSEARRLAEIGKNLVAAAQDPNEGLDPAKVASEAAAALATIKTARGPTFEATPFRWREPASIPPRRWAFGRWLLQGTAATVIAPGGTGKSTCLAAMAVSLATGREFLGKTVWGGRKRVWLWNLEDDRDELERSIAACCIHHGISPSELDGWLFVDCALEGKTLMTASEDRDGFKIHTPVFNEIAAEIKRRGIQVLIVDPFVSSHSVDENNNNRIDTIAKSWARVAASTGCLIIIAHHVAKTSAERVTVASSRGAMSLPDAMRSAIIINRMEAQEAERLGIPESERRRYLRIGDDKHNRAPAEAADWFRIASVDLGNSSDTMPSDSVGALEPWTMPGLFDDVTVDHLRQVQARIGERDWREHHTANNWCGMLVAEVLGLNLEEKANKAKVKGILGEWVKTGALRIEERPDKNREPRKCIVMGEPA
jgi:AAA domain/DnaB-like helicase N terminal domain